jgi:hypothetical protein
LLGSTAIGGSDFKNATAGSRTTTDLATAIDTAPTCDLLTNGNPAWKVDTASTCHTCKNVDQHFKSHSREAP